MKNLDKLKLVQEKLDEVSPTFCLAKWKETTLHLHNGKTQSCCHSPVHHIPVEEIAVDVSALHNTSYKKKQQALLKKGERIQECDHCWSIENKDAYKNKLLFSDRIIKSARFGFLDYWLEISNLPENSNSIPSYLEVSFSNLCNFKCSYCSPMSSSKWVDEIEKYGAYPTSDNFNDINHYKKTNSLPIHHSQYNPYVEAFWKWWPSIVTYLRMFRITGGEPLLSEDTFKVMEYLSNNPQPNLEFGVNTNGCVPDKYFDKFIELMRSLLEKNKIRKGLIFTSVDSWGPFAEYGRHGLNFSQWISNLDKLLTTIPTIQVIIMCTANIFSTVEFEKLLQMVIDRKVKYINEFRSQPVIIDISTLRFPMHQNLSILTDEYKSCFDASLLYMKSHAEGKSKNNDTGFLEIEILKLERAIDFMRSQDLEKVKIARANFYTFVNEHDRRRSTNFLATFPTLENFYNECQRCYYEISKR